MILIETSSLRPRLISSLFLPLYFKSQTSVVVRLCHVSLRGARIQFMFFVKAMPKAS